MLLHFSLSLIAPESSRFVTVGYRLLYSLPAGFSVVDMPVPSTLHCDAAVATRRVSMGFEVRSRCAHSSRCELSCHHWIVVGVVSRICVTQVLHRGLRSMIHVLHVSVPDSIKTLGVVALIVCHPLHCCAFNNALPRPDQVLRGPADYP